MLTTTDNLAQPEDPIGSPSPSRHHADKVTNVTEGCARFPRSCTDKRFFSAEAGPLTKFGESAPLPEGKEGRASTAYL